MELILCAFKFNGMALGTKIQICANFVILNSLYLLIIKHVPFRVDS